jgi:CHAT domain
MLLAGAERRQDYDEIDIRIFAPDAPGGGYTAELSIRGGVGSDRIPWPMDRAALIADAMDPDAYGRALGRSLFADSTLGPSFGQAVAAIQGASHGLRVRLRLDAPELHDVHWERMFGPIGRNWKPISVAGATPFSRWLPPTNWQRPHLVHDRPIKVLVIAASPAGLNDAGLDPIDPTELEALHRTFEATPELQATFLQSGTPMPATLDRVRATLPQGFHIVHVLSHGAVTPGGTVLYLEAADGSIEPVSQERIVEAFGALAAPPLLCFLAACESAARSKSEAFVPLGPALVQDGGVQAVVAMSDKVGQETARVFTEQFYRRLLAHGVVDLAVNEARALIKDRWDWGVPVLFTRLDDNQLIDFPVGRISEVYFAHTDNATGAIQTAIAAVREAPPDNAMEIVSLLNQLIEELSKSHRVLVDYASAFRDLPNTTKGFKSAFEAYYLDFKRHYDAQDWVHEDTSCGNIQMLSAQLLPMVSGILDQATFGQLAQELAILGDSDRDLLGFFREYLDQMDAAVEQIKASVDAKQVAKALETKRAFEAQISPSFRRSKDMLASMRASAGAVMAA